MDGRLSPASNEAAQAQPSRDFILTKGGAGPPSGVDGNGRSVFPFSARWQSLRRREVVARQTDVSVAPC
jgi:hypothetical protein